jgi:23S rRNA pseudouridine2457 synthase
MTAEDRDITLRYLDQVRFPMARRPPRNSAPEEPYRYFKLYKPYDVLCQFTDDLGRSTLADYVPVPGVYSVGRLDRDSEGLLLLTDDGGLSHRLTDPRFEHPKTYLVQVEGEPDARALDSIRRGVVLKDGLTRPANVDRLEATPWVPERSVPIRFRKNVPTSWLRLTIREGRNRQVRRMTAAVGFPTLRLIRISLGPVELGNLAPGELRELSLEEITQLQQNRSRGRLNR